MKNFRHCVLCLAQSSGCCCCRGLSLTVCFNNISAMGLNTHCFKNQKICIFKNEIFLLNHYKSSLSGVYPLKNVFLQSTENRGEYCTAVRVSGVDSYFDEMLFKCSKSLSQLRGRLYSNNFKC